MGTGTSAGADNVVAKAPVPMANLKNEINYGNVACIAEGRRKRKSNDHL